MKEIRKRKYITYNETLNAELQILGFKRKDDRWFVREFNDTEQRIGFSHATYSEKHVKYYAIHVHLVYPKIQKIIDTLGVLIFAGFGVEIGYLMPENKYYEWRITETDSDSSVEKIVINMVSNIQKYVIPYIEKYSTINRIIKGLEKSELKSISNDKYLLPILYYLEGDKEHAIRYVEQTFLRMHKTHPNRDVELVQNIYGEKAATLRKNKNYYCYKDFVEKFTKFVRDDTGDTERRG